MNDVSPVGRHSRYIIPFLVASINTQWFVGRDLENVCSEEDGKDSFNRAEEGARTAEFLDLNVEFAFIKTKGYMDFMDLSATGQNGETEVNFAVVLDVQGEVYEHERNGGVLPFSCSHGRRHFGVLALGCDCLCVFASPVAGEAT